jgi:hypothetical protein
MTTAAAQQKGPDPLGIILSKLDTLLEKVGTFAVDLRGVSQNWDKALPANDPGGPCPSNSTRFTCVFDGAAVRDNQTGLVWERAPDMTTFAWSGGSSARLACVERATGGQRGWRLPSIHELNSLLDPARTDPALPEGHPFANVASAATGFWSATTTADGDASAWSMRLNDGFTGFGGKTQQGHVWCVRGGMNADHY